MPDRDSAAKPAWEPISTAPKDGTHVLLYSPEAVMQTGFWHADGDSWVDEGSRLGGKAHHLEIAGVWVSGGGWFQPNEVTHWMPLPEAPDG